MLPVVTSTTHALCFTYKMKSSELPKLSLEKQNSGKNKARKRKHDGVEYTEEDELPTGDSCSQILSALRDICTCFGVGGLYNAKKRKVESKTGLLAPLDEEWIPAEIIQNLPMELKTRYTKEISETSYRLLGLIKNVSSLFLKLHGGRKFMKDITMDIYLKDVKTNPSLSLPEQYKEIGLWRQVLQVNQQVCQRMEEFVHNEGSKENADMSISNDQADQGTSNLEKDNSRTFHDFYMEMVTSSFGDDLDHIRQEGSLDARKVEMLINCLETGKGIWSDLEKNLLQSERT